MVIAVTEGNHLVVDCTVNNEIGSHVLIDCGTTGLSFIDKQFVSQCTCLATDCTFPVSST